jgi:hypothetical protein
MGSDKLSTVLSTSARREHTLACTAATARNSESADVHRERTILHPALYEASKSRT